MLGYDIYGKHLEQMPLGRIVINTINAYSYVVAKRDPVFNLALKSSNVLLPDGFSIVFAVQLLGNRRIRKIAGEDVFLFLLRKCERENLRVFFLGASEETLAIINDRISNEYPNILVGSFSPPYKDAFSKDESEMMIRAVNSFEPNVLFVGMTAPKQEKWVFENRDNLNVDIVCSIGAVFDFYAEAVSRPSSFWINLNLEWFIRLLKEPRRLWKRYIIYSPLFFIDVFKAKIRSSLDRQ